MREGIPSDKKKRRRVARRRFSMRPALDYLIRRKMYG